MSSSIIPVAICLNSSKLWHWHKKIIATCRWRYHCKSFLTLLWNGVMSGYLAPWLYYTLTDKTLLPRDLKDVTPMMLNLGFCQPKRLQLLLHLVKFGDIQVLTHHSISKKGKETFTMLFSYTIFSFFCASVIVCWSTNR